jgi:hypothetical protein
VSQEVGIHSFGDLGLIRRLLDDLLDAAGRVWSGVDSLKKVAISAIAKMRSQLLGKLGENGDIPTLPAFGFGDQDHLLIKEKLVHLDVHKLRDPGAGLE